MHFVREILLRNVKCLRAWVDLFHNDRRSLFHIRRIFHFQKGAVSQTRWGSTSIHSSQNSCLSLCYKSAQTSGSLWWGSSAAGGEGEKNSEWYVIWMSELTFSAIFSPSVAPLTNRCDDSGRRLWQSTGLSFTTADCASLTPDKGSLWWCLRKGERYMKATGIVRRVDDLGRIVIPKEIRRTLKIREGDPLLTTLTPIDKFCIAIYSLAQRITAEWFLLRWCR